MIERIKAQAGIQEKRIEAEADIRVAQIQNPPGFANRYPMPPAVAPAGNRQNNTAMPNHSYGGRQ
jgi:hypothetical protein